MKNITQEIITLDNTLSILNDIYNITGKDSLKKKNSLFKELILKTEGSILKLFDRKTHRKLNISLKTIQKVLGSSLAKKEDISLNEYIQRNEELTLLEGKGCLKKRVQVLDSIFRSISLENRDLLKRYYSENYFTIGYTEKSILNLIYDHALESGSCDNLEKKNLQKIYVSFDSYSLYNTYMKVIAQDFKIDLMSTTLLPMLADYKDISKLESTDLSEWSAESKLDGIRVLIRKKNHSLQFWTRSGLPLLNENMKTCLGAQVYTKLEKFPLDYILDGQLWASEAEPGQGFRKLSPVVKSKKPVSVKAEYTPFDLIYIEDEGALLDKSYNYRRNKLIAMELLEPIQTYSFQTLDQLKVHLKQHFECEGLVLKKRDSVYEFKRSLNWLKLKPILQTIDVLVIKSYKGKGKFENYYTSFDVAVLNEKTKELIPIGQVGCGFKETDLLDLKKKVQNNQSIILELRCEALLRNKDSGNLSMRFPRALAVRTDKTEISTLSLLKEITKFTS